MVGRAAVLIPTS
jgi:hypothetical protein